MAASCFFSATEALSQAPEGAAQNHRFSADTITADTRIGLALSGGGAKGFAHLGFIKVLEEIGLPVRSYSRHKHGGTGWGALRDGYTTEQLEELHLP